MVLQMEEVYYRIAKKFGLNTFEPLFWHDDTLFIPRFDVCFVKSKMKRFGLESLASGIGIAEFGARPNHEKYLEAIAKFSTDPANDLKEYLLRDILNVALGNTDNHPRNTAFLKTPQSCRLSPLFDFAPMWMDTEGITRVCRWADDREVAAQPNWHNIRYYLSEAYEQLKIDWELFFSEKKAQLIELKNDLHNFDMDIGLADYCHENIELQIQELQRALK